jgi:hypothetical protein
MISIKYPRNASSVKSNGRDVRTRTSLRIEKCPDKGLPQGLYG